MPTAGTFCVPAALEIITGECPQSVIFPALNRHGGADSLLEAVGGAYMHVARKVLEELGWTVRAHKDVGNHQVRSWAKRFPDRVLLIATPTHAMVLHDGRVFDSWEPAGKPAGLHAFANVRVTNVYLVSK